jgi:hypothetical protein
MPPVALVPSPLPSSLPSQTNNDSHLSYEHRMLCVGINLRWKKLNKYYTLTDESPVYVAAVVLHPGLLPGGGLKKRGKAALYG